MSLTVELETCTIMVRIFHRPQNPEWSYAVFVSRLTGDSLRLTIPELIKALQSASRRMREKGTK